MADKRCMRELLESGGECRRTASDLGPSAGATAAYPAYSSQRFSGQPASFARTTRSSSCRHGSVSGDPQASRTTRRGGAKAGRILVEEFVPGIEVALEGLLTDGWLRTLALFDKPDPLKVRSSKKRST